MTASKSKINHAAYLATRPRLESLEGRCLPGSFLAGSQMVSALTAEFLLCPDLFPAAPVYAAEARPVHRSSPSTLGLAPPVNRSESATNPLGAPDYSLLNSASRALTDGSPIDVSGDAPSSPRQGANSGTKAVTLYYGGDWDGRNALSNEENTAGADGQVYDDVRWRGSWHAKSLFSRNFLNTNVLWCNYDIRKNVSPGNAGTSVIGGPITGAACTVTPTGGSGFGFMEYEVRVSGLDITLPGGHYWINVQPHGDGTGASYQSTTSGANHIGSPYANGNSYFFNGVFFYVDTGVILGAGTWDFSGGVGG
jgi:hypothetical protein